MSIIENSAVRRARSRTAVVVFCSGLNPAATTGSKPSGSGGTVGRSTPISIITASAWGDSSPCAVATGKLGSIRCVALPYTVAQGKKNATSTSKIRNNSATT